MKTSIETRWQYVVLAYGVTALLAVTSGCAFPKMWKPPADEVAQKREKQREQQVHKFEEQRDSAQYLAAIERWTSGDPDTCEAQLRVIVTRNPKHIQSRRALADMALERGQVAQAEAELRELLAMKPDDPQTHHSLGLLLEAEQRQSEAREHLARAAELDPENLIFQLCLQNQDSTNAPAPVVARRE